MPSRQKSVSRPSDADCSAVAQVVAIAPPLTRAQRERLAVLVGGERS